MTTLTIAQAAADEIGIPRPSSLVGSTDPTARQMLALLNRQGHFLARGADLGHIWGAQCRDKAVTVTSGTATYAVPTDFLYIVNDTMWDTTNDRPMILRSSQEWQAIKRSGLTTPATSKNWRLVGESDGTYANAATSYYVEIDPTPTNSTDTFFYEYVSSGFARQNADAAAGTFDHDSDNPIFPEQLFILGLIWRWKRAKGLDYTEEKQEHDRHLETAVAQDRAARKFNLARNNLTGPHLLNLGNVPETGFGS